MKVRENFALAELTTLKVGGAARFFVEAENETEIVGALNFSREKNLPLFVLGGGSNVLVSDAGFDGLVLKIVSRGIEIERENDFAFVTVQAGEDWDEFVRFCVEQNLAGVECLSGIPGSCGATPVQNVGAYGQEVSETIISVRVLERASGEIFDLSNDECRFAYRTSIFNTDERESYIVLAVTFRLKTNDVPALRYKDLQQYFVERKPNLKETREAVLKIRQAKSMVIAADDPNSRSAGSFFKNPLVNSEKLAKVEQKVRQLNLIAENQSVPHFAVPNGEVKIPAAWLIEKAGFYKGFTLDNRAAISSNHTLAIVNRGDATANDVVELMREIQKKTAEIYDIRLEPEPVFVGF